MSTYVIVGLIGAVLNYLIVMYVGPWVIWTLAPRLFPHATELKRLRFGLLFTAIVTSICVTASPVIATFIDLMMRYRPVPTV